VHAITQALAAAEARCEALTEALRDLVLETPITAAPWAPFGSPAWERYDAVRERAAALSGQENPGKEAPHAH
jgi:hypothetical protein